MKRIIDKNTGQLLYASLVEVELLENEMVIEGDYNDNFTNAHYNFEKDEFYEKSE